LPKKSDPKKRTCARHFRRVALCLSAFEGIVLQNSD
jgi:hypothetical protein